MAETLRPKPFKADEEERRPKTKSSSKGAKVATKDKKTKRDSAIPKEVANRMARRIAITTGLPTFCGMGVFVVSYLIVSKGIADIAPALTLLISAVCFMLGLFGLSYGILSASWENSPGSLLGLENIRPNIGKVRAVFSTLSQKKT